MIITQLGFYHELPSGGHDGGRIHDSPLLDDFVAVATQESPPELSANELTAIVQEVQGG